jgi:hypothetical protein
MALEEEIRILRQDVEYIKGVLAELVDDSLLTIEEGAMVKEARRDVNRGDLSDFIDENSAHTLCIG